MIYIINELIAFSMEKCCSVPLADSFSFSIADAHYYLNLDRCAHGGVRPVGSPLDGKEMVRGAEIVAVDQSCTTVYYHAEEWEPYETGRDIVCTAHP